MNWLGAQIHPELCFGTYTFFRDLVSLLSLSITYIRLGEILLLSHFFCDLYPFRNLVMFLALSVTYIRLGRILLLSHFFYDLHLFRDHHVFVFISNLHLSRRNLVT